MIRSYIFMFGDPIIKSLQNTQLLLIPTLCPQRKGHHTNNIVNVSFVISDRFVHSTKTPNLTCTYINLLSLRERANPTAMTSAQKFANLRRFNTVKVAMTTTYNVSHWGDGYFAIDAHGNVIVHPHGQDSQHSVVLAELVADIAQGGLALPILVRFVDILQHRITRLQSAFASAKTQMNYQSDYISVYPIKVNQQKHVIDEIVQMNAHPEFAGHIGLEAGSKPELLTVLGLATPGKSVIVCNGYKDNEYIRLALIGQQLGHRVYIIIERFSELAFVLAQAQQLNIVPLLGVRVRLHAIANGHWQNSGGDKSKFGLSARELLNMVETLRAQQQLDCLQCLHCHMGSQIANIHDIRNGLVELARYYTQLHSLGVKITAVDIGGGLGVDYTGLRSRQGYSVNYSLQEYANNVVNVLHEACIVANLPEPMIISETGRGLAAHHAVLITNVIDVERPFTATPTAPTADAASILHHLHIDKETLKNQSILEIYHDLQHAIQEAYGLYTHGVIDLATLAQAEQLYLSSCQQIKPLLNVNNRTHRRIFDELSNKLSDKLFVNFSIFQSIPDVWAINQTFPIMPLTGLNKPLTVRATVHDITCDSDGCIEDYVIDDGIENNLPVIDFTQTQTPFLGIFLVGAYQEILGDMHNLFGDTHAINVKMAADGSYQCSKPELGDTVSDVLRYVHLDIEALKRQYQTQLQQAKHLSKTQQQQYLTELLDGLDGYTYLED